MEIGEWKKDIYVWYTKKSTHGQLTNDTHIEANIDVYIFSSDSKNNDDKPTAKNDDGEEDIHKVSIPKGK